MHDHDLAFFTNGELIAELVRRKTFLGVIVHCEDDYRGDWGEQRIFKVQHGSNLAAPQAGRLLEAVAEHIDGTQMGQADE